MVRDWGDYAAGARRPDGFQFAEDVVSLSTHSGTHMDALCHVWRDDQLYNGFPASAIRTTTGARRCGAERLLPVVTRGVMLDLEATISGSDGSHAFTATDLERAACDADVSPQEGDVVLLRTGWMGRNSGDEARYFSMEPGIDVSAARWLVERGVATVGADNYAIEVQPSYPGTSFPVHQFLLRDCGVPLIENMVLDGLADAGRSTFLFVAAPISLVGSTAAPVTPIAVL